MTDRPSTLPATFRKLLLSVLFVASPLLTFGADDPAGWRAGAASVIITPEKLTWLAGFAARQEPAHGVAQDLHAKALALEDARGKRMVFVTMDLIGVLRETRDAVERRVEKLYGVRPESLLLNASHTHCGPEPRTHKAAPAEEALGYRSFLEDKLVGLIGEALDDLAPAELFYGQAAAGFAMNRRGAPGKGRGPAWTGVVDHEVPVLRVVGPEARPRAILFGYACHATTVMATSVVEGQRLYEINGDYPGFAQEELEKRYPGAVALFMNGCGGDQNPYPRERRIPGLTSLETAERHGQTLATAVMSGMAAAPQVPVQPALASAWEDVKIQRTGEEAGPFPYPVQVVRLGHEVVLVALGSEVVVDYSLRIKEELRRRKGATPAVWVAGYSNGYFGYIPSERVLAEGGYEAGPWEPGLEKAIVGAVHRLHGQLEDDIPQLATAETEDEGGK